VSNPQPQQQQNNAAVLLPVTLAAATTVAIGAITKVQLELFTAFAALIARYGVGDLLRFAMRKAANQAVAKMQADIPGLVDQVINRAVADGAAAGSGGPNVPEQAGGSDSSSYESHAERSARAIREDLQGKLNQLGYRITRYADDVYRAVTADASVAEVLGLTPAQAQHEAYRKLVSKGITGYRDSRGRDWELSAYVEMAVRSSVERAFNVSHLDRMQSLGIELFTVTDDGAPCPLCAPWQGQVLSALPDPRAAATIGDARAAGLFHPRCKHTLVAYFPGMTIAPPGPWTAQDQQRYDDTQRQRALERQVRAAKRFEAAAFTPEMKAQARAAVRRAQAQLRDFVAQTGGARNWSREQLNLGA
jgi:hypothetical protein